MKRWSAFVCPDGELHDAAPCEHLTLGGPPTVFTPVRVIDMHAPEEMPFVVHRRSGDLLWYQCGASLVSPMRLEGCHFLGTGKLVDHALAIVVEPLHNTALLSAPEAGKEERKD